MRPGLTLLSIGVLTCDFSVSLVAAIPLRDLGVCLSASYPRAVNGEPRAVNAALPVLTDSRIAVSNGVSSVSPTKK
jgi:hypothetical protein